MRRLSIPESIADRIVTAARHRCCVCPEHRRIAHIHHMDGDSSNNADNNLVGLCTECHADAHTSSNMRRSISATQLNIYRDLWNEQCAAIPHRLAAEPLSAYYYINIERVAPLMERHLGQNLAKDAPIWFKGGKGRYNCLWANKYNSLDWNQLLELRQYLEESVGKLAPYLTPLDLSLLERGQIPSEMWQGEYLAFRCTLSGRDVPDQSQLVDCRGDLDGPPATLRREYISNDDDYVFETCMLLNPRFFILIPRSYIYLKSRYGAAWECAELFVAPSAQTTVVGSELSYWLRHCGLAEVRNVHSAVNFGHRHAG